jgi:hypothetical protein
MAQLGTFAERFEALCVQLFTEMGYDAVREVKVTEQFRLDIVAQKNGEIETVIDVKLVTNSPATLSELRNIVSRSNARLSLHTFPPHKLLLILSCVAEEEHLNWLEKEFTFNIWDRRRLKIQVRRFPKLSSEMDTLFKELEPIESQRRES